MIPSITPPSISDLLSTVDSLRVSGVRVSVVANGLELANAFAELNVDYVTERSNSGFGRSINFAASQDAEWQWLLLLNDDLVVDHGLLAQALDELQAFDSHDAVHIVYYDPEQRRVPRRIDVFLQVSLLGRIFDRGLPARPTSDEFVYHSFSAVAISRHAWESLGGFDENLPFTYEDADFVRRAHWANLSATYRPESGIHHLHSVSSARHIDRVLPVSVISSLAYLQKWYVGDLLSRCVVLLGLAIRVPLSVATRAPVRLHLKGIFRAIRAVILGDPDRVSLPGFEEFYGLK